MDKQETVSAKSPTRAVRFWKSGKWFPGCECSLSWLPINIRLWHFRPSRAFCYSVPVLAHLLCCTAFKSKQYHVSWLPAPFLYRNRNFFQVTLCLHRIFNKVSFQLTESNPILAFSLLFNHYIWEDSSVLTGEPYLNPEATHTSGKCEEAVQIWTQGCYIRACSSHLVWEVTWAHQADASIAKATALKPNSTAYFRANPWNTARF